MLLSTVGALVVCTTAAAQAPTVAGPYNLNIPSKALAEELNDLAQQSGWQLLFPSQLVAGLRGPPVKGALSIEDALRRLLINTNLRFEFVNPHTIAILSGSTPGSKPAEPQPGSKVQPQSTADVPIDSPQSATNKRGASEMPHRGLLTRLLGIFAVCGPALHAGGACAQDANTTSQANQGTLQEVVVTARKQEESLMAVPVAATVVSGANLAANGITDLSSIGTLMPSVNFDKVPMSAVGALTIRGIGSSGFDATIDQAVATVTDGVQTSRGAFLLSGLLDVSQVEVLKGPQALFFGKNSPGGVVSIESNGPTDTLSGYVNAGYETNAEERNFEGAISGPLTDQLRARVAFRVDDMRGWISNGDTTQANPLAAIPGFASTIYGPPYTYNGDNSALGRLTVDYKPTTNFTATFRLSVDFDNDNGQDADLEITHCPAGTTVPVFLGVPDTANECSANNRNDVGRVQPNVAASDSIFSNGVPYSHYNSYLPSLTLNYTYGPIDFTSVTGVADYARTDVSNATDSVAFDALGEKDHFHQFSEELRAVSKFDAPVNFSAGLYFDQTNFSISFPTALFPLPADPTTGSYLTYILHSIDTGKTYSAFAQARWDITRQLQLDAGLRYSQDHITGMVGNEYLNPNAIADISLSSEGTFFSGARTYNNTSPEVTLNWKPVQNTMLYASYKTGYKSGAPSDLSIIPSSFTGTGLFYLPERIHGYEVGLKSLLLNNHLRVTLAGFRYDYSNLQVSNFNSTIFQAQALNAGGMRTQGFEAAVDYKPIDALTLSADIGDADARYTDFGGIDCYAGQTAAAGCLPDGTQNLSGQQKFRAPQWTGNLSFLYERPAFGNYLVGLSGAMRYSSNYYTEENNNPASIQDAYETYDAGIQLRTSNDQWRFAFLGRNLGDKQYMIASYDAPLAPPGTINSTVSRPRQLWLQATYRY